MSFGWLVPVSIAVVLDLLVLYCLARGPAKRFPFVFVTCATQLLVNCFDTLTSILAGTRSEIYVHVFWTGDMLAHAMISLLMISLIWQALEPQQPRRNITALLVLAVLCFASYSVYTCYNPSFTRWMNSVSRNLSFGEEFLNLNLWMLLLQRRNIDQLLLLVSAGIGIQVTGEAIGHTLRLYTQNRAMIWIPNNLVFLAEILCLLIWIWAFRAARKRRLVLKSGLVFGDQTRSVMHRRWD